MDNNQEMEEMMSKMIAGKMSEVQENVETKMRAEMEEKEEVMREEMKEVKKQLDRLGTMNVELTTKLQGVDQKSPRDVPYVSMCAYQSSWDWPLMTIRYERLSANFTSSGGEGDMDISSGTYTRPLCHHLQRVCRSESWRGDHLLPGARSS